MDESELVCNVKLAPAGTGEENEEAKGSLMRSNTLSMLSSDPTCSLSGPGDSEIQQHKHIIHSCYIFPVGYFAGAI